MPALILVALAGMLFGSGLVLSHMVEPQRVLAFLDITGDWDPTLAFVMASALAVTIPAFHLTLRRGQPLLTGKFSLPDRTQLDKPLILGAVLFGIGWGLAGYCPGPALTAIALGWQEPLLMVAGMITGGLLGTKFIRQT